jgi:hypothetical protein
MEKYIKEVGLHNVVQVCIDNASSMKAVANIITNKFPHIYFQGCAVYAMNLLLEDWGKATWMKEAVKKSRTIVNTRRNTGINDYATTTKIVHND